METSPPKRGDRSSAGQAKLSPWSIITLAIACGLAGGFLEVAIIILKKYLWNGPKNFGNAYDFPWTVPVGHVLLLAFPSALLALLSAIRPRSMTARAVSWLFLTLTIWFALLRLPLFGIATLILAIGASRHLSLGVAGLWRRPRACALTVGGLGLALVVLALALTGWRRAREDRMLARLPAAPSHAPNVILVIWDTVRAANLSIYDYPRNTTPNLAHWARRGVRYSSAIAPGPWTYPSHTCFFTGYWPFQLESQWKYTLDATVPTLAESLASVGYETAGFAANTLNLNYETRLDRGFTHFEDYRLTPQSFFTRTAAGSWVVENLVLAGNFYAAKWVRLQSRNAGAVNREFLEWLETRQTDRPFLAYLNYFDAHEPYMPPPGYEGRFGIRPRSARDFRLLLDYGTPGWKKIADRDIEMARDCYDDCIAFLDDHLGRLLDELDRRRLVDNTLVIITSDHGESFGDHGLFLHGTSLFLDEIAVPLVILAPGAPANRLVTTPVSLRDLPATIVDLIGLSSRVPFPGKSLATCWRTAGGTAPPETSHALSEHATETAFRGQLTRGLERRDVQMSLVASGRHYIRDGFGREQLYDLVHDPTERVNLMSSDDGARLASEFRKMLLHALDVSPGSTQAEKAYLKAYRQWLKASAGESIETQSPLTRIDPRPPNGRD